MPACCRGMSCNCRIDAGSNVNVSGSGQPEDPFVVSASPTDLSGYDTIAARQDAIAGLAAGRRNVVLTSGGYLAEPNDYVVVDATAGPVAITLPAGPNSGSEIGVKKVDASANVVSVVTLDLSTIDGDPDATISAQWGGGTFIWDGTNWLVSGGM